MGKIAFTLAAVGAVAGGSLGVGSVWEFEDMVNASAAEQPPAVQTSSEEFHFWEDVMPEVAAAGYGGLAGAVVVGGLAYVAGAARQRRTADV